MTIVLSCGALGMSTGIGLAGGEPLTLARSIELPGVEGRLDHMALDERGQRLFIAAVGQGSLEVVDLAAGKHTRSVAGLKEAQGVAFLADAGRIVVACGGDGMVRAFDAESLKEVAGVKVGDDADNIRVADGGKTLVAGFGDGGLAVLDAGDLHPIARIALDAHPESFQIDASSSLIYANLPGGLIGGGGRIAVVDRAKKQVTETWTLREAGRNFPMALDVAGHRLFVGCRRPAKLLAIDTQTGKTVALPACVEDADDVFFDAGRSRVYVAGGEGFVDVFEVGADGSVSRTARVASADGARTALLSDDGGTLYVAAPKHGKHAASVLVFTANPSGQPPVGGR